MGKHLSPNNNNNRFFNNIGNYNTTNPFFIDPYKDSRNRIKEHSTFLIKIFKSWFNSKDSINEFNVDVFDVDHLFINIASQIFPTTNDQQNSVIGHYEMILSHLECKDYQESYSKLFDIVECQDHFNKKMLDFLESNLQQLKKIIGRPINYDILRYYLVLIVDDNRDSEKLALIKQPFKSILLGGHDVISNPFSKYEEEKIRKDMTERYVNIVSQLNDFKKNLETLNKSIICFRRTLDHLICDEVTGIEGKCYIEKKLSSNKFKSRFYR